MLNGAYKAAVSSVCWDVCDSGGGHDNLCYIMRRYRDVFGERGQEEEEDRKENWSEEKSERSEEMRRRKKTC